MAEVSLSIFQGSVKKDHTVLPGSLGMVTLSKKSDLLETTMLERLLAEAWVTSTADSLANA